MKKKSYLFKCIIAYKRLLISNNKIPKHTETAAISPKMEKAPSFETEDAKNPAAIFATKLLINHTPINTEANFTGANLDTIDKPIGDKHNSPTVCKR